MYFSILSTAVTLASIPAAVADVSTITINAASRGVTWEGWGTSLAWWAKAFGDRDDLANAFFGTEPQKLRGIDLPGLGFNIARYNAGATSHNSYKGISMVVSPAMKPSRQIEGFWLNPDPSSSSWNWTVDSKQRTMLHKAKKRGANIFELFSNSPMWWMCGNHNPSGNDDKDNLPPRNYQQHAIYMATVEQHFRQAWGIKFQSVEPFNEPSSWWGHDDGTQEGCHFDVSTMDQVVDLLKTELTQRHSRSFIAASDETSYDKAISTWEKMNSATRDAIKRINVHGYQGGGGRRDTLYSLATQSNKALWNSEYGDDDGTGKQLATNLLLDFQSLHPTAWVYWQAVDGGGWGLIAGDNDAKSLSHVNTKYFVLAQFSRHIRPGMKVLSGGGNANTVAAWNPKTGVLVIVTANWGPDHSVDFDLSRFGKTWKDGDPVSQWNTKVDGSKKYHKEKNIPIQGTRFRSWVEKDSVQTYEIRGVTM